MIIWCLLLVYITFVRLVKGELASLQARRSYMLNVGIVTAFVVGCRGNNYQHVYDLTIYTQFFTDMAITPWELIFRESRFDEGFIVLTKLLSYLSSEPQVMIFASSLISVGSVSYFIYKNTDYVFEAFFFFITLGTLGFMMSGIRQSIAISIGLFMFEFVKRKKFLPFVVISALALSIHKSSLVLIVSCFLVYMSKLDFKSIWACFGIIIAMFAAAPVLLLWGSRFAEGEFEYTEEVLLSFNGVVPILIYCGCIVIESSRWGMISNQGELSYESSNQLERLPLLSIGIGFYILRFYNRVLERLALYFTPISILCLSDFVGRTSEPIKITAFISSLILFWHRFSAADYGNFVFFWNL